ncbi:hypothetical protein A2U09_08525 [Fusobacterium necrophorum subsp. funduliforme]|uniref:hypothetical protein n=1 Tax=Fusobacterium necrophorum TaxID=859 RepID=UPI000787B558|nr:hypothetical protein [Fusobacterium necrophorum]KYM58497.1 hypothetical protein A2U09_08525 [Fusobacterium necrophorum subsp. funduliforme]
MSLNSSGRISLKDIAKELGKEGKQISFNDQDVLTLAGKTSGQQVVLPNDFWGKSYASVPAEYPYNAVATEMYMYARNIFIVLKEKDYLLKSLYVGGGTVDCIFDSKVPHENLVLAFEGGTKLYLKKESDTEFVLDESKIPIVNDSSSSFSARFNILIEEVENEPLNTEDYILTVGETGKSFGYVDGVGDITPKTFKNFNLMGVYTRYNYVTIDLKEKTGNSNTYPSEINIEIDSTQLKMTKNWLITTRYEVYSTALSRVIKDKKEQTLRIKIW